MTETEKTKLFIEQSKVINIRESELWEFMRLPPSRTGLDYDIFVDNGGAYKHHNHKLWLYVSFDSQKIPITVEENPSMFFFLNTHVFKYSDVLEFIKKNQKILKKLADGEIDEQTFFKRLQKVDGKMFHINETSLISEMATLKKETSNLPTTIWLDDDKLYEPHAPRIKFRAVFQNHDTHNDPSMEIENPQIIHNLPTKIDLKSKEIEQIRHFVAVNKERILALANKEIDFGEFLTSMQKVDINGNIISDEIKNGKCINGFTKCEKNGKFNFLKTNGEYLFSDFCLDAASDFNLYVNGKVLSYVTVGDNSYYINSNGKKANLS